MLYVVNRDPTAALSALLAVQSGTIVALAVTVWVLLAPTVARLERMRIGRTGPLLGPGPAERPAHPHGEAH
jgi:hypothetical protein